jgi:hypothetical protein
MLPLLLLLQGRESLRTTHTCRAPPRVLLLLGVLLCAADVTAPHARVLAAEDAVQIAKAATAAPPTCLREFEMIRTRIKNYRADDTSFPSYNCCCAFGKAFCFKALRCNNPLIGEFSLQGGSRGAGCCCLHGSGQLRTYERP